MKEVAMRKMFICNSRLLIFSQNMGVQVISGRWVLSPDTQDQGTTYMMRERFAALETSVWWINESAQMDWRKIQKQALEWVFEYLRRKTVKLFFRLPMGRLVWSPWEDYHYPKLKDEIVLRFYSLSITAGIWLLEVLFTLAVCRWIGAQE